ncbi:hypothetical protein JHK85_004436 [Glycine max]|nr:hypothetical protein JHK85_004436 [Glycine max]
MKLKVVKGGKDHPVQTSYDTTVKTLFVEATLLWCPLAFKSAERKKPNNAISFSNPSCEVPRPPHNPNTQGLCLSPSSIPMTKLDTHASPPPFLLQRPPLFKQRSWSPDAFRDEAWLRRKGNI